MADNRIGYGFRLARSRWGQPSAPPLKCIVATAESFDVSGGTSNVLLGPGDPVKRLATGGVTLCDAATAPYGIVAEVGYYWDGTKMVHTGYLPSDTAWGTNLERQSTVLVWPAEQYYWEVDCDDSSTFTTLATYQAAINENCSFILCGGVAPVANPQNRAHPRLDISTHAVTDTLIWRIVGISESKDNADFSGNYVKLIVELNIGGTQGAASLATTSKAI